MSHNVLPKDSVAAWLLRSALGEATPKGGKSIEVRDKSTWSEDGPIRPLAIGDGIRRIALRARIKQVGNFALRRATGHNQTGVAVPAGAEIASFRLKLYLRTLRLQEDLEGVPEEDRKSNKLGLVSCDVQNAFQNMDRNHLLDAVNTRCPQLNGLARFLYSDPGEIILGVPGEEDMDPEDPWSVNSTRGVHQGCPLGPILFAIGL